MAAGSANGRLYLLDVPSCPRCMSMAPSRFQLWTCDCANELRVFAALVKRSFEMHVGMDAERRIGKFLGQSYFDEVVVELLE